MKRLINRVIIAFSLVILFSACGGNGSGGGGETNDTIQPEI